LTSQISICLFNTYIKIYCEAVGSNKYLCKQNLFLEKMYLLSNKKDFLLLKKRKLLKRLLAAFCASLRCFGYQCESKLDNAQKIVSYTQCLVIR